VRSQRRLLDRLNIDVDNLGNLNSANAAIVIVTAMLPPGAKRGTRLDVQVSSLYDAESLQGGMLLDTHLLGSDDRVYAVAQGSVSVGGFAAGGGGAAVTQNHVTVGRVPRGGHVVREVPTTITDGERIMLLVKQPRFETAAAIERAINGELGAGAATALNAGAVMVRIPPANQRDLIGFIASVNRIDVQTSVPSRVVLNERTGTIVLGGDVIIRPCQVAHGNLTIQIATTPVFPEAPLLGEEEREGEVTDIEVEQQPARFLPVQGTSAAEVADVLNRLQVTPTDMIAIFQALRQAGALEADLEIM
jgi:flagellar P-ring protein precursor FlgI